MADKVCMIIGGGRGMGAATAREMAAKGYKLSIMSPSESCEKLAAELGGVAYRGKAENAADTQALFDLTMQTYGRIDAVFINCGGPPKGDLLELSEEDWDRANDMLVKPVIRVAKMVVPVMEKQGGGSIVNLTSYSAMEPSLMFPTSGVYRLAVSGFTRLIADRYGPANIRMNCLLPGFTDSLDVGKFADLAAMKRIGRAEEQGKAAAFLLSDDSSFITGQSLVADGGLNRHV